MQLNSHTLFGTNKQTRLSIEKERDMKESNVNIVQAQSQQIKHFVIK